MVNRVTLIGRLGKDPEIRRLESGAAVAKFSVATNESYKDSSGNWQDKTEWHDIIAWRQLAERAESSLKKGALLFIEGKLTHRKWQDKDGNNRYTTEVVANYFRTMPTAPSGNSNYFPSSDDEPVHAAKATNNPAPATTNTPAAPSAVSEDVSEAAGDDLPF